MSFLADYSFCHWCDGPIPLDRQGDFCSQECEDVYNIEEHIAKVLNTPEDA
jgi:predicted nucleic acid-binding Zn ribbon protein